MSKPSFVYVIYIASTPEKVFAALTQRGAVRAILVRLRGPRRTGGSVRTSRCAERARCGTPARCWSTIGRANSPIRSIRSTAASRERSRRA